MFQKVLVTELTEDKLNHLLDMMTDDDSEGIYEIQRNENNILVKTKPFHGKYFEMRISVSLKSIRLVQKTAYSNENVIIEPVRIYNFIEVAKFLDVNCKPLEDDK